AVVLVGLALAAPAAAGLSAKGELAGSGTSYGLLLANTGSEPIRCMRWFAPAGTTVSAASGPGSTSSFGGGFGSQKLTLPPGKTAEFRFRTNRAVAAAKNGALHISTDCVSDVIAPLAGPKPPVVAKPKPLPKPKPVAHPPA